MFTFSITHMKGAQSTKILLKFYRKNAYFICMIKRFLEWINLKVKIDSLEKGPPLVKERDIWWISFGENIGSEISGKSGLFSRPGLVLKKLARGLFMVAPTTSQKRVGTWYVHVKQGSKEMYVCLHQIRCIDYRRLSSRLGVLDEKDFKETKDAFEKLYK